MLPLSHRTKVVATIGPASNSPEVIRQLIEAGMAVARLNFSHGSYEDHAKTVKLLREISEELDAPVTLLQDLQGPKVRVGQFPNGAIALEEGSEIALVPLEQFDGDPGVIPIDYPFVAEEAYAGMPILLDDGQLELQAIAVEPPNVVCKVVRGGLLKSRKGVNFPSLNLRLPSMTEKDCRDLEFGLEQGIDWVALSFVRSADDIRILKDFLQERGAFDTPVIAKIEKPQAINHLEELVKVCDGIMVARGDLGVELKPESVPLLQKKIIRACNQAGIPVITATQMLESMIENARPTRAEASDVANAILDGTDAVMLSGESAVGKFPVEAVKMMGRIAATIEPELQFDNLPPDEITDPHALSEAITTLDKILDLRYICAYTTTGYSAKLAAAERPKVPVVAFTPDSRVYHRLNLVWGAIPILLEQDIASVESLVIAIEECLQQRGMVQANDKILILGGSPVQQVRGTNFLKIHTI
ncbi:pyruvate kinase [Oscillatoria sp. FACHB-1406]|uniref:pyruvate kinase n=1 Tax=Oscillatoria sp. FACHB-1406 TaxID=2692846 RepID=UPI0016821164|nr:pyruvate kinase [Oscillatoria sp. FACHB-1406]MBD2576360.1 pyruvate kinase [Oscillatoria sp. FACHB-1406]